MEALTFNLIAYLASFVLSIVAAIYIMRFSFELVRDLSRKNLETNLFFLGANMALLIMLAIVIKQTLGGVL